MALAVVQAKKIETGTGNSVTVNAAMTATSGNLMVVGAVEFNSSQATGIAASDNVNGSYTQINESAQASGTNIRSSLLYKANITGGSLTLTASGGTAAGAITASFHEVSGADTITPFTSGEQASGASASAGTNPQTSTVTNSVPDSVFFAVMGDDTGANQAITVNSTGSSPTGWALKDSTQSQETDGTSLQTLSMPFLIVASSAATKHGWTMPSNNYAWSIACFGMASAGGFDPSTVPWLAPALPTPGLAVVGF